MRYSTNPTRKNSPRLHSLFSSPHHRTKTTALKVPSVSITNRLLPSSTPSSPFHDISPCSHFIRLRYNFKTQAINALRNRDPPSCPRAHATDIGCPLNLHHLNILRNRYRLRMAYLFITKASVLYESVVYDLTELTDGS